MEKYLKVIKDVVKPWMDRVPLHLQAGQCADTQKQVGPGVAADELAGGVGEGDLAFQLAGLQPP
jgi:hypothetical protein